MVDLVATSPCAGLLPVTVGSVTLAEAPPRQMASLAPLRGREADLDAALRSAHGLGWPAPNQSIESGAARVQWFGREMALLIGPEPDPGLAGMAALTDQSDAWAVVVLDGAAAGAVLARLTPLDLRPAVFGPGKTARSALGHMPASLTCLDEGRYEIMVFRAFAETLVHELSQAMSRVAARGEMVEF